MNAFPAVMSAIRGCDSVLVEVRNFRYNWMMVLLCALLFSAWLMIKWISVATSIAA